MGGARAQERTIEVLDPASGEHVGRAEAAGPAEVERAVAAAAAAQGDWARRDPAERGRCLAAAAEAVLARAPELAELQTRENGRPVGESLAGVLAGASTLEEFARLGPLHGGGSLRGAWDALDVVLPEPRGVAAALVPWNDPVAIACGPIGACLATGNALLLKPSEKTPLSSLLLGEIVAEHLPPGVLTVLAGGPDTGRMLVRAGEVGVVLHTGSVATGREVAAVCGERLVRVVAELGGKDPLVVDEDVDPAWAAAQAASGAFANAGQVCTSVERIYVHERVAAPFAEALVACAEGLVPGHGLDAGTTLGPLIDEGQREIVRRHVEEARARGARVLHGGRAPAGPGWFFEPTVLLGAEDDMAVMREETFGPVAAVRVVRDFDEGLAAADAGDHGLAATVLTASQAHAQRAIRGLRVGTVKVNAVWGGAPGGSAEPRKASGTGLGYGPGLMDEVTARKVVHLAPADRFDAPRSG